MSWRPVAQREGVAKAASLVLSAANVGAGGPPTNRLGSSVGERLACHGVAPGSIPGLAYSFLFLQRTHTTAVCTYAS